MAIKNGGIVLVMLCQFVAVNAVNQLYLENHYGAPIICKVFNNNVNNNNKLKNGIDTVVNNQSRVWLGTIPHGQNSAQRLAWVIDLAIKTNRYLSGGYTQLKSYVEALGNAINGCCNSMGVLQEYREFCTKNLICNKDAIIVVYPSNALSGWNIDIQWKDPKRTIGSIE